MNFKTPIEVGGRFKADVYRADGSLKTEGSWSNNLVLDSGLAMLTTTPSQASLRLYIGTGSSEPIKTQSKLDSTLAMSSINPKSTSGGAHTSTAPYYVWGRDVYRFDKGTATGNITEMGLGRGSDTTTYTLFNRVLVKDALGNPTAITVLEDEYLEVTVELRMYFTSEFSGSFNLLDKTGAVIETYNYTGKPLIAAEPSGIKLDRVIFTSTRYNEGRIYEGSLSTGITTRPSGGTSVHAPATYPSVGKIEGTINFGIDSGINNKPQKSFVIPIEELFYGDGIGLIGYQWELDKPITKTDTQELTYNFSLEFTSYVGD